ncbi:hybrid sensor histidine kinase/response regulator [Enterovibrio calviensis]|uniref:hybrid sensor histidine kinase/response regulator n=1 Tax=Enterovibrio calviensis TaxID=91359 RepID=UPI000488CBAC|nr:ATP-binding protein [Enterovibrio calviensis]
MTKFFILVCAVIVSAPLLASGKDDHGYLSGVNLPEVNHTLADGVTNITTLLVILVIALAGALVVNSMMSKRTQEEMREQRQLLKQAEKQLQIAKKAAQSAQKAKRDFLSNMSHEFRTPLNAIIGMSQLALDAGLEGKQQQYIRRVVVSGHALLDAVNATLDFTNVKAGNLEIEWVECNVETILSPVAKALGERARDKGLLLCVNVDMSIPKVIDADIVRMTQVLMALGDNAIKFTDHGEVIISVSLESRREDDVKIRFAVTDTGIGIKRKELDMLFQPFSQADTSTSRAKGGKGLGLSLAKELVALMGGDIHVESRVGIGTTLSFTLPCQSGVRENTRLGGAWSRALTTKSVLVIASHTTLQSNICDPLVFAGANVSQCRSFSELEECQTGIERGIYAHVVVDWEGIDSEMKSLLTTIFSKLEVTPQVLLLCGPENSFDIAETRPSFPFKWLAMPTLPSALMRMLTDENNTISPIRLNSGELGPELELEDIPEEEWALRDRVILLVEDNLINQEVAIGAMESLPVRVLVANNGDEAIQLLKAHAIDLVLMDMQMPVVDGVTATKIIRREMGIATLPILAMTANTDAHDVAACREAGMNEHIAKPINFDLLKERLIYWLANSEYNPEDSLVARLPEDVSPPQSAVPELLHMPDEDAQSSDDVSGVVDVDDTTTTTASSTPSSNVAEPSQAVPNQAAPHKATPNLAASNQALPVEAPISEASVNQADIKSDPPIGSEPIEPIEPIEPQQPQPKAADLEADETRRRATMEYNETMFDLMVDNVPGINLADGVKRLGGNKAKYLKILSLFLNSQVSAIEQLLTLDDNSEKAILAHSCKGAGSNIGADEMANFASGLEDKYNAGEPVAESDVLVLKTMVTSALEKFDEIAESAVEAPAPEQTEDIKPLDAYLVEQLNALQVSLQEFDIEVQDKVTVLAKALPRWCNQLEEFQRLQDAINQFDFLTAEDHLKELKKKTG